MQEKGAHAGVSVVMLWKIPGCHRSGSQLDTRTMFCTQPHELLLERQSQHFQGDFTPSTDLNINSDRVISVTVLILLGHDRESERVYVKT